MLSKRRIAVYLTVLVLGLALAWRYWPSWFSPPQPENPTVAAPTKTPLRIAQWGQERYLIYLPLYVALDQGLLEQRGVAATVQFTGNDDQTFSAVVAGRADVGVGDPAFAAIAAEKGISSKVLATIVGRVAIWGLTKRSDLPVLNSAADLEGLRVGTFPEPSTNYSLMKRLTLQQRAGRTTTIVQAPIGSQLALLANGAADIAMELEPGASVAEEQGYRVVFSSPKQYGPFAFTGITTTDAALRARGADIAALIDALDEAVALCHRDPRLATTIAQKAFPRLSATVVSAAITRMLAEETIPRTVRPDLAGWHQALSVRKELGELHSLDGKDALLVNDVKEP